MLLQMSIHAFMGASSSAFIALRLFIAFFIAFMAFIAFIAFMAGMVAREMR